MELKDHYLSAIIMDDVFSRLFLNEQKDCVKYILDKITNKDLRIIEINLQKDMVNFSGHSAVFDVFAKDSDGKYYNIELENSVSRADVRRARYHSSLIDITYFNKGINDYSQLAGSFVIFVTTFDPFGLGSSIYYFDRVLTSENGSKSISDGSHIIYVNGTIKSSMTELEKLIHDLNCSNPDDMFDGPLKNRMIYMKSKEGVEEMGEKFEQIFNEKFGDRLARESQELAAKLAIPLAEGLANEMTVEVQINNARTMLSDGLDLARVAKYSNLPIEKVKEIQSSLN